MQALRGQLILAVTEGVKVFAKMEEKAYCIVCEIHLRLSVRKEVHTNSYTGPRLIAHFRKLNTSQDQHVSKYVCSCQQVFHESC